MSQIAAANNGHCNQVPQRCSISIEGGRHVRENPWPKLAETALSQAERHDELAWQYRRAARYPWLFAPLDPPPQ